MTGTMRVDIPLAEQVASLEEGYASLLLENKQLGEEMQAMIKQVRELEDQQAITRQAYQNLLHEKDTAIKGLDDIVQEKLVEIKSCHETIRHSNETITRLNEALADARECNDRLDARLERESQRQQRTAPTATSVRIEGGCECDHPGPFDRHNRCQKCGNVYVKPFDQAKAPIPPTFGEVQLAKSIYHNPYYMAIRQLLTFEGKRVLDVLLKLDGVSD